LLPLAIVVMVIGPMAATLQGSDYFSINFTSDFLPWDGPDDWRFKQHFATLNENGVDQVAGYDRWATNGWLDVLAPWNMPDDLDPPQPIVPVTITSTSGATAAFTFNNCRNGWTLAEEPNESGVGNYEMMNACAWGTEDASEGTSSLPDEILDITISDIPFTHYDAIFYFGSQSGQWEDGNAKFELNGGAMQDIIVADGYQYGTFTEVPDLDGDPNGGNFMLVENLTGSTLTIKLWGNDFQHVGLCGFQFGEYDPNSPTVNAGTDDKIILSGMSVDMDASIVNNDTYEPQRDLDFVWSAEPSTDIEFIPDEFALNPTVNVTANPDPNAITYEVRLTAWLVNPSGPNEKPAINTMTIDVYSDACKAIIASGQAPPYDSGDLNTDCTTSLKDIAITGEKWLVDYKLTEPVAKP
jgi:hypothetical protein